MAKSDQSTIDGIKNMTELRARMLAQLSKIESGKANILEVDQFTKLSGKIIASVLVEVRAATVTHDIDFLK